MKLSQAITITAGIMTELCDRNSYHQQELHNETDDAVRNSHEHCIEKFQEKITALAVVHGCYKIMWPGLYPTFVVLDEDGLEIQLSDFKDVIALEFGQPSFPVLLQNEVNTIKEVA